MTKLIDMGWGDLRLQDSPQTRVTQEQAETLVNEDTIDAGASEVRFGQVGDLLANRADGTWIEIGADGTYEDVTREVMG